MTSTAQLSRVLLVAEKPAAAAAAPGSPRIRRYKLATLREDARDTRFSHLRRSYD